MKHIINMNSQCASNANCEHTCINTVYALNARAYILLINVSSI